MAFVWKPAIYGPTTDGNLVVLPRPVEQFDPAWAWKMQEHEVPRKDGVEVYGNSYRALDISISGQFAILRDEWSFADSGLLIGEEDMWAAVEEFRGYLDVRDRDEFLELFIYHDQSTTTYRKFKQVYPTDFTVKIGDNDQGFVTFKYNLSLKAENPAIFNSAPGA